jgi:hypothetical protein
VPKVKGTIRSYGRLSTDLFTPTVASFVYLRPVVGKLQSSPKQIAFAHHRAFPAQPNRSFMACRAIVDRKDVHVPVPQIQIPAQIYS